MTPVTPETRSAAGADAMRRRYFDLSIAGYLLNATARAPEPRSDVRSRSASTRMLFAAVWVVTAWLAYRSFTLGGRASWTVLPIGGPLVWLAVAALWIRMAEGRPARQATAGALNTRWWQLVEAGAAVSYGVYLWHVPILQSVSTAIDASTPLATWAILFAAGLALTLAMAAATRATVERAASGLRHEAPRGG
jgi:peptidoglycan/LPS O-acetylase OafA/YrhL